MRYFTHNNVKIASIATAVPEKVIEHQGTKLAIASEHQTTSDLGYEAAKQIFEKLQIVPEQVGVLVFITKTPDYRGPATSMVIQHRLQIPQDCIVYDAPNGNAGFEQSLNLGASLLNTSSKDYALLIFGDTISKQLNTQDTIDFKFQDGASAILLEKKQNTNPIQIGIQTLSKHWRDVMVPSGGFRNETTFFDTLIHKRAQQESTHFHLNLTHLIDHINPELMELKNEVLDVIAQNQEKDIVLCVNFIQPILEQAFKNLWSMKELESVKWLGIENNFPQTMGATSPNRLASQLNTIKKDNYKIISLSIGEGLSINRAIFDLDASLILETIKTDLYFDNGHVTHEM